MRALLDSGFMVAEAWAQGSWCRRQRKTPAALVGSDDHGSLWSQWGGFV